MEIITSRKNAFVRHLRLLAADSKYRAEQEEFLCDGRKLLDEAAAFGAEIRAVLWKGEAQDEAFDCQRQYIAERDVFDFASPMNNSPGPIFTVAMPKTDSRINCDGGVVVLEGVQDPGNVGTVIRTANAFGISAVVLTGGCADLYNPKTVRATMGAVFRQQVITLTIDCLPDFLRENSLKLYGAALSDKAADIRTAELKNAAVAVGSEGKGLSRKLLDMCDKQVIIPMAPNSESLNAAVAAAVIMWEMRGKNR